MSSALTRGQVLLAEMEAEVASSRNCLTRISEKVFDWKPHPKSMPMGYLALLVAEIPLWIATTVERTEIDFATFTHFQPKTTAELVSHLDENVERARRALRQATDTALSSTFHLRNHGKVLFSQPIGESVAPRISISVSASNAPSRSGGTSTRSTRFRCTRST